MKKAVLVLFMAGMFSLLVGAGSLPAATWERIGKGGLDGKYRVSPTAFSMQVFDGKLYVGLQGPIGCRIAAYDGTEWKEVVGNGFGNSDNQDVLAMAVYGSKLVVGTMNLKTGAEVWSFDGKHWQKVSGDGFGDPSNSRVTAMTAYNGKLYAGTESTDKGCEIWSYDGTNWSAVQQGGFGNPNAYGTGCMTVFQNRLFVGVHVKEAPFQIWAFDGAHWEKAAEDGFGDSKNYAMHSMTVHNGALYAGTFQAPGGLGSIPKCQIWSYDGTAWDMAFERQSMGGIDALTSFNGSLFFSVFDANFGCRIVRIKDGKWKEASKPGFGYGGLSLMAPAMVEFDAKLYVAVLNMNTGSQVWSTSGEGTLPFEDWAKASPYDGFSSNHNAAVGALAQLDGKVYAGTWNSDTGCELWGYEAGVWSRIADQGFGSGLDSTQVTASVNFDSKLFLGTSGAVAGLYTFDGSKVEPVSTDGFGKPENESTAAMAVYNNQLYIGANTFSGAGQVYRYEGGTEFTLINTPGFGDPAMSITSMAAYGPALFVGTFHRVWGAEVWSYQDGVWTREIGAGYGDLNNVGISSMAVLNNVLYVGVMNGKEGCQIWRCDRGIWKKLKVGGFKSSHAYTVTAMAVHKGKLYLAVGKTDVTKPADAGCEIWSYNGGKRWTKVSRNGFGNPFNSETLSLLSDGERLLAGTMNYSYGAQVWATTGE